MTQSEHTEQSLKRIASEKRSVESEFPRTGDPNSTDDAYLHGKWQGLRFALQVLQEERGEATHE
jgi:hypothetical protein